MHPHPPLLSTWTTASHWSWSIKSGLLLRLLGGVVEDCKLIKKLYCCQNYCQKYWQKLFKLLQLSFTLPLLLIPNWILSILSTLPLPHFTNQLDIGKNIMFKLTQLIKSKIHQFIRSCWAVVGVALVLLLWFVGVVGGEERWQGRWWSGCWGGWGWMGVRFEVVKVLQLI